MRTVARCGILLLLIALPNAAVADDWTATDTALQLTAATLQVVDWGQTRWGRARGFIEANPALGETPGRLRLDAMVGGAILGSALVAYLLPQPYRAIWQMATISVEVVSVSHNAALFGVHWAFP